MIPRDLLRAEAFGGVYYNHHSGQTLMLPPGLFALLLKAQSASLLDVYAADPSIFAHGDRAFAEKVSEWLSLGFLDQDFRCPARLVENPAVAQGLSAPLTVHIDLTTACNLRCLHCYVGDTRVHHDLSAERLLKVFAELDQYGVPVVVLTGGEPLLRPDLFEILDGFSHLQLDGYLCTNATLIDQAVAQRIAATGLRGCQVSLDGPDASSHDAIRGQGSFARAMTGLRALMAAGVSNVQLRVTATQPIVERLIEFAPLATDLGVKRVVIKPLSLVGRALKAPHLALNKTQYLAQIPKILAQWPKSAGELEMGDGIPHKPAQWTQIAPAFSCPGGTATARVSWDAKVLACSDRADDDWSLAEHDFIDCWRNAPSVQRWRKLEPTGACQGCAALATCSGGCRMRALAVGGGLGGPDPWASCAD